MKNIYVVTCTDSDYSVTVVSNDCYTTKEKAIEFCKSRLSAEELKKHEQDLQENLISWYTFYSKDYVYEIEVLSVN